MSGPRPLTPEVEPKYDPSRPFPGIKLLYKFPLSNCPGKTIVATKVNLPKNGATPPHTHAGAFVSAYVISGYILNKMNNGPMKVLQPGDTFSEDPGCRHRICDNMSTTETASIFSTMVVDTKVIDEVGVEGLVVIDEEYRDMVAEAQGKS